MLAAVRCLVCSRILLFGLAFVGGAGLTGCGSKVETPSDAKLNAAVGKVPTAEAKKSLSPDELREQIDKVLDFTFQNRRLNVAEQNAWQIVHGALAFGREFLVTSGDKDVSAVDYVLAGGKMNGWNLEKGDLLDEKTGRYGVRAKLELGSMKGQGHADQWMGYLAGCQLPLETIILVEGKPHSLEDYLRQVELDVSKIPNREYSWTLMGLTAYRPSSHHWTASDGKDWSITDLVEAELDYLTDESPCGGTHRMYGLTMARNQHLAQGGKLEGVWKKCDERIRLEIGRAKQSLNSDGSLSSHYFQRPGSHPDLTEWMASSGHVYEFLAAALTAEELKEPWMQTATAQLCSHFRKTKAVDVECARLFHAAHGLVLYRERVFGPRTFGEKSPASKS